MNVVVLLFLLLLPDAQELALGQAERGTLGEKGDSATYALTPETTTLVTISLDSYDFDAHLAVLADDVAVFEDDNSGIETNARLVLALSRAVRYRFVVSSRHGSGEFDLRVATGRIDLTTGLEESARFRRIAAERALDRGDPRAAAIHSCIRGEQLSSLGNYTPAIEALEASLAMFEELTDKEAQVRALEALAYCHLGDGSQRRARRALERTVKLAAEVGMTFRELNAHKLLVSIYRRLDEPRRLGRSLDRRFLLAVQREDEEEIIAGAWEMLEHCRAAGHTNLRKYLAPLVTVLEQRSDEQELRRAYALYANSYYGVAEPKKEWALKGLQIGRPTSDQGSVPALDRRPLTANLLGSLAIALGKLGHAEDATAIRDRLQEGYAGAVLEGDSSRALEIAHSLFDMGQFLNAAGTVRRGDAKRLLEAAARADDVPARVKVLVFLAGRDLYEDSLARDPKRKEQLRESARKHAREAESLASEHQEWHYAERARWALRELGD